jgi:hypothetical protein
MYNNSGSVFGGTIRARQCLDDNIIERLFGGTIIARECMDVH